MRAAQAPRRGRPLRGERRAEPLREGDATSSRAKLLAIAILLERLRIHQRLAVLHLAAVHDVAHRELDDLVALRARNVRHLDDLRRYVAWRGVGANRRLHAVDQRSIKLESV